MGILAAKGIERARVELSSDVVLAALYSWIRVTVMSDAKGEIVPCPFGIPEKMLDRLFADCGLRVRTIDDLTREAIEFSLQIWPNFMSACSTVSSLSMRPWAIGGISMVPRAVGAVRPPASTSPCD